MVSAASPRARFMVGFFAKCSFVRSYSQLHGNRRFSDREGLLGPRVVPNASSHRALERQTVEQAARPHTPWSRTARLEWAFVPGEGRVHDSRRWRQPHLHGTTTKLRLADLPRPGASRGRASG